MSLNPRRQHSIRFDLIKCTENGNGNENILRDSLRSMITRYNRISKYNKQILAFGAAHKPIESHSHKFTNDKNSKTNVKPCSFKNGKKKSEMK